MVVASIKIELKSDVEKPADTGDLALVHRFRTDMASVLRKFGPVAYDPMTDRTSFASIHDLATFFLTVPSGEIALKFIEIAVGLDFLTREAERIWNALAPGAPVRVSIENISIDGRSLGEARTRSVESRLRLAFRSIAIIASALLLVVAGAFFGWWDTGTRQQQETVATPPSVSVEVNFHAAPAREVTPRRTASPRPSRTRETRRYTSRPE